MVIIVKHKKGRHYANLKALLQIYYVSLFKRNAKLKLTFSEKSKYNLNSSDNYDWCKIIGRGGVIYKNGKRKEEQFIVWRYIWDINQFHVSRYSRVNYQMQLPTAWISIYDKGSCYVEIDWLKSLLPIGGYFGGNMPAPCDLEYKIEVL